VKGFLGSDNLDTNSRLCMASAVAGYRAVFGADAPPGGYADIDLADVFLIVGANVADCHPSCSGASRSASPPRPRACA
jgi:anaerobic selenocysteine-containing dehydrogenase